MSLLAEHDCIFSPTYCFNTPWDIAGEVYASMEWNMNQCLGKMAGRKHFRRGPSQAIQPPDKEYSRLQWNIARHLK